MRLYYTGASPNNIRKARQYAPSHSHGYGWTPTKMTKSHDAPYFLDNGAYSDDVDPGAYYDLIDEALREMPTSPDFIVLPDVYEDAEATIDKHREWLYNRKLPVGSGQMMRYWVIQPGVDLVEQFEAIEGCQGVFVGGPQRWKRAHGAEIVALAQERGLRTHVGNPGGEDGLVWAYETGFDSTDTTSVFQNQYWHYLTALEDATAETDNEPTVDSQQATVGEWTA
jgi:hypothetical protein